MSELDDHLLRLFQAWRAAEKAAQEKEIAFKGGAALVHGADATWEYNEQTGLRFIGSNVSGETSGQSA